MPETTSITVFNEFETGLATLEATNETKVFDMTTSDGVADCRAWHKKLRKATNALDKIRKDAGAEYLRLGREVNAEAKTIQVRLDVMELPHKTALDAIEATLQAKIDAVAAAAEAQAEYDEDERLAHLENREIDATAKETALKAQADALQVEKDKIEAVEVAKQQVAEEASKVLKALIAKDVKDKQDALDKAEADKQAAIQAVKDKQAQDEADRLAKESAAKAKQEVLDGIERKRVADVEHRKEVEGDIHHDMTRIVTPIEEFDDVVPAIITAIKSGLIPHLQIVY